MDDIEDDARYPPSSSFYRHNRRHRRHNSYSSAASSHRPKFPGRTIPPGLPPVSNRFRRVDEYEEGDDDDDDDYEEEVGVGSRDREFRRRESRKFDRYQEDEEEEEENLNGRARFGVEEVEDEDDEDEADDDEFEEVEEEEERRYFGQIRRKKRRLDRLAHGYEFVPRAKAPVAPPLSQKVSALGGGGGSRNSQADWSEQSTFALLDVWGDRFLQLGRKSLRSDEWVDVARKVSQASRIPRTETQCRNRLDTLKKKYKKEKIRMAETGSSSSKWIYFKKMDMLMTPPPQPARQSGLSCGLDSGEYVFMNPRVYLNKANGMDEMSDSPGNSEFLDEDDEEDEDDMEDEDGDDMEGLPPSMGKEGSGCDPKSYKMLAESVRKFGEIYEKIENSKRQQMMELERMRTEFHRDLEVQKRQILERAQTEIAKIREGEDEEIDVSMENGSG